MTNPFKFAAQYLDSESGMYYMRARYYDPVTAQFISKDPALATTREPYVYMVDSPLSGSDPTGLCWPDWACGVENGLATGVNAAAQFPAAAKLSFELNVESNVSVVPYAVYRFGYDWNRWWFPHSPVRGAMSQIQRWGLHADERFDKFEQATGYPVSNPCHPENDEGMPVTPLPSLIYPEWNGSTWTQQKISSNWHKEVSPGREPNGKGDFAD